MYEFFSHQLTWEVFFGEVLWGILLNLAIWSFILSGALRAVVWLFNIPLRGSRAEVAFWAIVPIFILVVALFATFMSGAKDQQISKPLLRGEIDAIVMGRVSGGMSGTAITVLASIRNLGTPSIVEGWALSVSVPGAPPMAGRHQAIPETLNLERPDGPPLVVRGRDALYDKTTLSPVGQGNMQRGYLLFLLERVDMTAIYRPGTRIILTYKDVTGKSYVIEKALLGQTSEPSYLPGLSPPN